MFGLTVLELRRFALKLSGMCALMATLSGCATGTGQFVWIDSLSPAQKTLSQDGYTIGTGDLLAVQVYNHPEMSGRVRVLSDGKVTIGLVGDVPAAGKTPAGLAREIERISDASKYSVGAKATVSVEEVAPIRISVLGEVSRAGQYSLEPGAGLSEALASAGGFTDFAHRDRLFIVRRTPTLLRIRFTFDALSRGQGEAALFRLRSGDVLVVE